MTVILNEVKNLNVILTAVGWAYLPNAYIFCSSGHYLQTLTALKILCISVTPFSLARHGSLRKEGKIRLLDYWQFKSFCTPFRFVYTNLTSSNFFTGRAGFDLTVSLGALAKIRLLDYWQFKSFCTPFRFVYTNLTSSNFFTGRAGFDLTVSLGALAKIRKKKLWTCRFIAIRLGICVSSSLFKEYSVILHIL